MSRNDACVWLFLSIMLVLVASLAAENNCKPGLYGEGCLHRCRCQDRFEACDSTTGHCLSGCSAGYMGKDCSQECDGGHYGINCAKVCQCQVGFCACHHVTGSCDTADCTAIAAAMAETPNSSLTLVLPLTFFCILGLVGLFVVCFCCARRRKDKLLEAKQSVTRTASWISAELRRRWSSLSRSQSGTPPEGSYSGYYAYQSGAAPSYGDNAGWKGREAQQRAGHPPYQQKHHQLQTSPVYEVVPTPKTQTVILSPHPQPAEVGKSTTEAGRPGSPASAEPVKPVAAAPLQTVNETNEDVYENVVQLDSISIGTSSTSAISELPSGEYYDSPISSPLRLCSPRPGSRVSRSPYSTSPCPNISPQKSSYVGPWITSPKPPVPGPPRGQSNLSPERSRSGSSSPAPIISPAVSPVVSHDTSPAAIETPTSPIYTNAMHVPSPKGQRVQQAVALFEATAEKNAAEVILSGRGSGSSPGSPPRRSPVSPRRMRSPSTSPGATLSKEAALIEEIKAFQSSPPRPAPSSPKLERTEGDTQGTQQLPKSPPRKAEEVVQMIKNKVSAFLTDITQSSNIRADAKLPSPPVSTAPPPTSSECTTSPWKTPTSPPTTTASTQPPPPTTPASTQPPTPTLPPRLPSPTSAAKIAESRTPTTPGNQKLFTAPIAMEFSPTSDDSWGDEAEDIFATPPATHTAEATGKAADRSLSQASHRSADPGPKQAEAAASSLGGDTERPAGRSASPPREASTPDAATPTNNIIAPHGLSSPPKKSSSPSLTSPPKMSSSPALMSPPKKSSAPSLSSPTRSLSPRSSSSSSPEKTPTRTSSLRDRPASGDKVGKSQAAKELPPWNSSTTVLKPSRRSDTVPRIAPRTRRGSTSPRINVTGGQDQKTAKAEQATLHCARKPPLPHHGTSQRQISPQIAAGFAKSDGGQNIASPEPVCSTSPPCPEEKLSSGFLPELGSGRPAT